VLYTYFLKLVITHHKWILQDTCLKIPKLLKPIFLASLGRSSILKQMYSIFHIIWAMGHPGQDKDTKHLIILLKNLFSIDYEILRHGSWASEKNSKINNYLWLKSYSSRLVYILASRKKLTRYNMAYNDSHYCFNW